MKAYIFNIHDVVLVMTAIEAILLAVFQAALPAKKRLSAPLLSIFLVTIATLAAGTLVLWNPHVQLQSTLHHFWVPYLLVLALMMKGPILYLYVSSITRSDFRIQISHALHLLPALAGCATLAIFGLDANDLRYDWPYEPHPLQAAVNHLWDGVKIVPLGYALAAIVQVRSYQTQLKDEYSHFSTTGPNWLNVLTLGFFISWSWSAIAHLMARFSTPETADYLGIADNYVTFILINALFTYSLVYAHQLLTIQNEKVRPAEQGRPSESAVMRVKKLMEGDKVYLKHNLNIEQFSRRVELPVKEVSSVINKHFGTNFFEFVNSYRIDEAKRLLADPTMTDKTVLDILMDSGFNSKSAFHRFFKRLVGMSPSEYRRRVLDTAEEVKKAS